LTQVEWACSDDVQSSFNGVNLTGDYAQACDRYRTARVPLKIDADTAFPFADNITVPSRILSQIIRQTGTVSLGCTPTELLVLPNEHVQIRARLHGLPYMDLTRIVTGEYQWYAQVRKASFLEILNRVMSTMAGKDRFPMMQFFVGKQQIAVWMAEGPEDHVGDILETPGYCDHDRVTLTFTPRNFIEAVEKCPSDVLNFWYDPSQPLRLIKIDDGAGYEAWVAARRPSSPTQGD
jgi:hypothetical protein